MTTSAKLSYLRISPRKVRLVADLVRGRSVYQARHQLEFSTQRASHPLLKLLNSAVSNAKDIQSEVTEENLYIGKIVVDQGPTFRRFRAASRGRAMAIQKKTSHVTIVLAEREQPKQKKKIEKKKTNNLPAHNEQAGKERKKINKTT